MKQGREVAPATDSKKATSLLPAAIWNTPRFSSPSTPASERTSPSLAMVEGIGTPLKPLWLGDHDEAKPMAPWRSASRTSSRICPSCSGEGTLISEPASPITAERTAECPISVATFR